MFRNNWFLLLESITTQYLVIFKESKEFRCTASYLPCYLVTIPTLCSLICRSKLGDQIKFLQTNQNLRIGAGLLNTAIRLSKYIENSSIHSSFYVRKKIFIYFLSFFKQSQRKYLFHFLLSCFSSTELTNNFLLPEFMAFTIPFVPPKKVSFPEDLFPLLPKFFL